MDYPMSGECTTTSPTSINFVARTGGIIKIRESHLITPQFSPNQTQPSIFIGSPYLRIQDVEIVSGVIILGFQRLRSKDNVYDAPIGVATELEDEFTCKSRDDIVNGIHTDICEL